MAGSSKIVALTSQNVKRITAVHIEPGDDGCVLIGGKNAQGKSSVLDSIMYALGGANSLPEEPIRHGEETAEITVDLGDIIVKRKFTASGSTVTVKTKDGASYSSPQKVLDGLFSKLSFDPLAFSTMKPADQSKALIALLGIDTSELDKEHARLYEERTGVNRLVKEAEADLARCEEILIPVPDVRPDVGEINRRLGLAIEASAAAERRAGDITELQASIVECQTEQAELTAKLSSEDQECKDDVEIIGGQMEAARVDMVQRHQRELAELQRKQLDEANEFAGKWTEKRDYRLKCSVEDKDRYQKQIDNLASAITRDSAKLAELQAESSVVVDVDSIRLELSSAEEGVHAFDVAKDKKEKQTRLSLRQEESEEITDQMDVILDKKRKRLAEANYPIAGLAVNEDGTVLFDGVPLSQASRAQQIRTSVAIGIAMNPKLKVLLIRDGSLLDEENMQLVVDMAKQHDAQIWIERVGDKDASAIIIEDGHVRGVEPAAVDSVSKPKKTRKKASEQPA
jgi:septal ring factor EnvC (AmiA/AmiB activator)